MNTTIRRLRKEWKDPQQQPIRASPDNESLLKWRATLKGPENTPYEGGEFYLTINILPGYPFAPPMVTFKTRIYHCTINTNGTICLDILKTREERGKWVASMGLEQVLMSIHALLCEPNPCDPLMLSIAQLLITNKNEHDRRTRLWTQKYAMCT